VWVKKAVSLLKRSFVLQQLMLRATVGTLPAMVSVLRSLLLTLRTLACSRAALHLEILALRHF